MPTLPRVARRLLVVFLFPVVCSPCWGDEPDSPAKIRVACLGDSITAGARVDAATQSYPAQLQRLLGDGYQVRNFGIGGATLIKTGRPNVWQALPEAKRLEPHAVVIALGTNDTVSGRRRNWEQIARFQQDYQELINSLAELPTKPRIFVCTPTAMVLNTPGLSTDRLANLQERKPRLAKLCAQVRKLAETNVARGVSLIDLNPILAERPDLVTEGDGVHPNAAGYRAIAEHVQKQVSAASQDEFPGRHATWHGYDQFHFTVDGRSCYVVVPKHAAPGKPWVWRARFPDYHAEMDVALLGKGYFVAYLDVAGLFGSPQAVAHGDKFYRYLTTRHKLASKPALEGVSRGGLFVYNWAAANPDKVACIYADTPVCDFKSWPGGKGKGLGSSRDWSACLKAYGLTEAQAISYDKNPVDSAGAIAAAKIPILHIVSENDRVVPPAENTYLLKQRLEGLGGSMEIISVAEGTDQSHGHHFDHPDPNKVVDFIVRHTTPTPAQREGKEPSPTPTR